MSEQKNPSKESIAVALGYDRQKDIAPKIVATGKGFIAEQIIEIAKQHNITIREDADLAGVLSTLELDSPVPVEAYVAIAEILSYVYRMNDQLKRRKGI